MYKMKVPAMTSINLKANRALIINVDEENDGEDKYINYAKEGQVPLFVTNVEIEKGEVVDIEIKDSPVWEIEAGEDILMGQTVYVADKGKVFPRTEKGDNLTSITIGYSSNDAKAGEVADIVRQIRVSRDWMNQIDELEDGTDGTDGAKGPKGDTGPTGPAGSDATDQFTAGEVTALKALLEE